MRRMFSQKQIEEMIRENTISQEEVELLISNKAVAKITPPESTTLTDDEIAIIKEGVFIEGDFLGQHNPILTPGYEDSTKFRGIIISSGTIGMYEIVKSTKAISLINASTKLMAIRSIGTFNGKNLPDFPASTGTFVLKCVDGTLTWVEEV